LVRLRSALVALTVVASLTLFASLALLPAACTGSRESGGGRGSTAVGADEAERLYQEGLDSARRAETAPLPTPEPVTSPLPPGAPPPAAPEFKAEELRALQLFEQALAARPDHAGANLALAELLAPHAIRRVDRERAEREAAARRQAAAGRRPRKGAPPPTPPPLPASAAGGVEFGPDRVLRAYQAAMQADPGRGPVDKMIAFAVRVGRLDAAEAGHQELLRRVKESAEPYALYGDFLAQEKKDRDGAIEQYRQALIWKPDDEATRQKLAQIYLDRGAEYYNRQEYALAAVEFKESEKYVTDRSSEQGQRLQSYLQRMKEIRSR
jgi:tetratricopeptide (TPR) repeat protein